MTQLLQYDVALNALRRRNGMLFVALEELAPEHPALKSVEARGIPMHTLVDALVRAALDGEPVDEIAEQIRSYYDMPPAHWLKGKKLSPEMKAKLAAGRKKGKAA